MTEALELMYAVARKLTGQAVTIRFKEPQTSRLANAATYKGLDGAAVIDIDPYWNRPDDELFRIFTHELAHVVLHLGIMTPVNVTIASAVYHAPSKTTDAATRSREAEAEALADTWRKFAMYGWENHYRVHRSRFISMLKALLYDYKK